MKSIEEKKRENSIAVAKYRAKHPERWAVTSKEGCRRWRATHHEKAKELNKNWAQEHTEEMRSYWRKYGKKRRETPEGRLNGSIARGIWGALRDLKAGRRWESLVGYTVDQLKSRLERQFKDGMTWENYGEWQIDHIIPRSAFNYKKPEDIDFKKCWALENLRPLWATENIIKKDKLNKPFQPSLLIMEVAA